MRGWAWVAVTMTIGAAAPAEAQTLHGTASVQYQKSTSARATNDVESWLSSFLSDYSTNFRSFNVWSQFQITDQRFPGRPERTLAPQGSLRLSHPVFGFYASHRPSRVTDARSITSRQRETMLSAYVQKPGLPSVNATWMRSHLDPGTGLAGPVAITRGLTSRYDLGPLALRAGYGDLTEDATAGRSRRSRQNHLDLGAGAQVDRGRASAGFQYDFTQTRRETPGTLLLTTRLHAVVLNGAMRFSSRTTSGFNYNFRHSSGGRFGAAGFDEHDGSLNVSHRLVQGVQISTGGGVRSADLVSRRENEGYAVATITAEGSARPGWRLGAAASHSLNWLPNEHGRPIDVARANTSMTLAKGLELGGDVTLSRTQPAGIPGDTLSPPHETTIQTGASLRATPFRSLTLNGAAQRFRPGASLRSPGLASTNYSASFDWRITGRFLLNGTWGFTDAASVEVADQALMRATIDWNARRFQTNLSYTRIGQRGSEARVPPAEDRESFSAWLALGLTRNLRTTFQYNAVDWGRPTRVRQVTATLTQSFGR